VNKLSSITIRNFSFTYDEAATPALNTINFSAPSGQIILISGKNGSGKSTLLACLSGIIPELTPGKLEGQILFGDNSDSKLPKDNPTFGVLLQDSDVYLLEEVYEELAFSLQNSGINGPDLDLRIENVTSTLGLSGFLQRKLRSLSGGERQKVAIGSALICDAPILLLDEPVEQLDPLSAYNIFHTLRELADQGKLILVCMHNPLIAAPWADRLVIIRDGELFKEDLMTLEVTPIQVNQTIESFVNHGASIEPQISINEYPVLEVQNLTYRYDEQSGIEDINLKINKQEILALIGPNGSGKSTLVKHFIGLLRPQAGKVFVSGVDTENIPTWELAKEVGILFQNPDDQIFKATVLEEIAWSLIARGLPKKEALDKARKIATDFELEPMVNKHPHDLSRSLRQLVALVSVLITNPKILILDEPTKMMDSELVKKVMDWLLEYRNQGGTILIITHDMTLVNKYTDRVAILERGRLTNNSV